MSAAGNGRNNVGSLTIRIPGEPPKNNRGVVGKAANVVTGAASGALGLLKNAGKTVRNTAVGAASSLTQATGISAALGQGAQVNVAPIANCVGACCGAGCPVQGGKRKTRNNRRNKRRATKKRRSCRR